MHAQSNRPPQDHPFHVLGRALAALLLVVSTSCASANRGLSLGGHEAYRERQRTFETMRSERRVALVIGNGDYVGVGSLKNPPNDADLMGRALESLGFSVTTVKNADWLAMKRAIEAFQQRLTEADVGLFYFAGHGVQRDDHNYLVPTAPAIQSAQDFDLHAIHLGKLMEAMRRAGPRMNIVILDACRNDPFPQSARGMGGGLAAPESAVGTVVAYAAAKGRVAKDGDGDHSPYTSALVRHMRRPNVEIGTMLRNVFAEVDERTDGTQQPWYEVAVKGQFYFNLGGELPADLDVTAPSPIPKQVTAGVSIAGFGGALLFGGMALYKDRELARACESQEPCPTKHQHLELDRNFYRSLAWIGAGVGTIALAGLWWLLSGDAPDQQATLHWSVGSDGGPLMGLGSEF